MRQKLAMVLVGALVLAGCGGGDDDTAALDAALEDTGVSAEQLEEALEDSGVSSEEIAEAVEAEAEAEADPLAGEGECRVDITGDLAASWTGVGGQTAYGSDYLYTEDELREQYDFLFIEGDKPFDDKLADGEAITFLLILNCTSTGNDNLSLLPGEGLDRTTLPYGPGSYPISGGLGGNTEAGFSLLGTLADGTSFSATGGTLDIEAWDRERIKGTWSMEVEDPFSDPVRTGQLTGSFDFPCPLPSCA
jgi:hypothetical protein